MTRAACLLGAVLLIGGCSSSSEPPDGGTDASVSDGGRDAGPRTDAGTYDAGPVDLGTWDGSVPLDLGLVPPTDLGILPLDAGGRDFGIPLLDLGGFHLDLGGLPDFGVPPPPTPAP